VPNSTFSDSDATQDQDEIKAAEEMLTSSTVQQTSTHQIAPGDETEMIPAPPTPGQRACITIADDESPASSPKND
jgi:hypothetical protein